MTENEAVVNHHFFGYLEHNRKMPMKRKYKAISSRHMADKTIKDTYVRNFLLKRKRSDSKRKGNVKFIESNVPNAA
jgi:hypothetical protein